MSVRRFRLIRNSPRASTGVGALIPVVVKAAVPQNRLPDGLLPPKSCRLVLVNEDDDGETAKALNGAAPTAHGWRSIRMEAISEGCVPCQLISARLWRCPVSDRIRHCDFYSYEPESDDDYEWVHPCCGGPWSERPEGHYADCPAKQLERSKP